MFFNSGRDSNVTEVIFRARSIFVVKIRKVSGRRYTHPHLDYNFLKSICDLFNIIPLGSYPLTNIIHSQEVCCDNKLENLKIQSLK